MVCLIIIIFKMSDCRGVSFVIVWMVLYVFDGFTIFF